MQARFAENWEAAKKTELRVGAYHFFSFDSPGESQLNPSDQEAVCTQLEVMLQGLEAYYGVKPVIYATEDTLQFYLEGRFEEYHLWIRNVVKKPDTGNRDWLFWQYTNRKRLDGYEGDETYIDVNVFCGSRDDWELWSGNFKME